METLQAEAWEDIKNASELPVSWPRLEPGTSEYM
jgi:hypothetical protein